METIISSVIYGTFTLVGIVLAQGISAWRTSTIKTAVDEVHVLFNSRMTELLRITSEAAEAKGNLAGVASEKASADKAAVAEQRGAAAAVDVAPVAPAVPIQRG